MTKIQYSAMKFFAIINLVYCFLFLSNWLRGDGERLGYGSSDEGLMSTIGCKDQWSQMGYGQWLGMCMGWVDELFQLNPPYLS